MSQITVADRLLEKKGKEWHDREFFGGEHVESFVTGESGRVVERDTFTFTVALDDGGTITVPHFDPAWDRVRLRPAFRGKQKPKRRFRTMGGFLRAAP